MIRMKRQMTKRGYSYTVSNMPYILNCNYTFGIIGRKITMQNLMSRTEYSLKQTKPLLKLFSLVPIFWICPIRKYPPYVLCCNHTKIGETKFRFGSPGISVIVQDHKYELLLQSNNIVLLLKDNAKIALIKKETKTVLEQNCYQIKPENVQNQELDFMILLTVLADLIFFPNRFRIDYLKYETTVGKNNQSYIEPN